MLTDRLMSDANEKEAAKKEVKNIKEQRIGMSLIAIGRYVNIRELQKINNGKEVPMFDEYEDHKKVGMNIIHGEWDDCRNLIRTKFHKFLGTVMLVKKTFFFFKIKIISTKQGFEINYSGS